MQILCRLSESEGPQNWLHRSKVLGLAIRPILESCVLNDMLYLHLHKNVPALYASKVRYEEEPAWTFEGKPVEEFALIPIVIARGWGDCLHEHSLVKVPTGDRAIMDLRIGDRVCTRHGDRSVTAIEQTAARAPLLRVQSKNGTSLLATPRHFFNTGRGYVRASELTPSDSLYDSHGAAQAIEAVTSVDSGPTWDMTVDGAHHFFAREPGTVGWLDVHNCDDLAPWRCAELRLREKEPAKIRIQWQRPTLRDGTKGRKYFHIVVRRADGRIEDPSAKLGMHDR